MASSAGCPWRIFSSFSWLSPYFLLSPHFSWGLMLVLNLLWDFRIFSLLFLLLQMNFLLVPWLSLGYPLQVPQLSSLCLLPHFWISTLSTVDYLFQMGWASRFPLAFSMFTLISLTIMCSPLLHPTVSFRCQSLEAIRMSFCLLWTLVRCYSSPKCSMEVITTYYVWYLRGVPPESSTWSRFIQLDVV